MFLDYFAILRWCLLQLRSWCINYSWLLYWNDYGSICLLYYIFFHGPIHCFYYCLKFSLEHCVELSQDCLGFMNNLITLKYTKRKSSWTFYPRAIRVYVYRGFRYLFVFTYDPIRKVRPRLDEVSFTFFCSGSGSIYWLPTVSCFSSLNNLWYFLLYIYHNRAVWR